MAVVTAKPALVSEITSLRKAGGTGNKVKVSVWRNTTMFDAGDVARLCAAVSIISQESKYFIQEEPEEYRFVLLNKKQERLFKVVPPQHGSKAKVASCPEMSEEWWRAVPGNVGNKLIYASKELARLSAAEMISRELDCSDPKMPLFKLKQSELACVAGMMYCGIVSSLTYRQANSGKVVLGNGSSLYEMFIKKPQSEREVDPNHPVIAPMLEQIAEMLHPHPLQLRFAKKQFSFNVSPEREKLQLLEMELDLRRIRLGSAAYKLNRLLRRKKAGLNEQWASEAYDAVSKKIEQSHELLLQAMRETRVMAEKANTKRLEIK